MEKYRDRYHAGKVLAEQLQHYAHIKNGIVLALPRGGVPVAYEVASILHLPLDLFIVRKLGVPGHVELAMGAVAMGGVVVFNQSIISSLNITKEEIATIQLLEEAELQRRLDAYRGNKPYPELANKTIILVDDGIATGASMRAAIMALRQYSPKKIIVAVPVADKAILQEIDLIADQVICPMVPAELQAVGYWYEDFTQTEDQEVQSLLHVC